jgi:hypothetical protein
LTKLIGSAALTPGGDSGTDLITKGDLHGYSSSNTRIPVGDNDQVLTADSSEALGLKWATPASSSLTTNVQTSEITSNKDITSTSYVTTGISNTLSNQSGGVAIAISAISAVHSSTNLDNDWAYSDDGSAVALETRMNNQANASNRKNPNPTWSMSTDGSVLAVYSKISSGTCTMIGNMCNHVITEIY